VSLARTLGYHKAADKLEQTLTEEKEADVLLTQIAEGHINYDAAMEPLTA
jgi:ferritin-like metal-binding protein YciE